jgi:transposase
MTGQASFFDVDERLQRLSDLGDQLEAYVATVDFEIFRAPLEAALAYADGVKGGRPAYDAVMMFKILVIQAQNNLSDDRTEFLINDRLSFMRFLGLSLGERVPDAKTIWLFRERLTRAGAIETLFDHFDQAVRAAGYIAMSGQIVDASLIAAPKQRNTDAEKTDIKAGRIPPEWSKTPARLRQKDRDARWTVKFSKAKPRADGTTPVDIHSNLRLPESCCVRKNGDRHARENARIGQRLARLGLGKTATGPNRYQHRFLYRRELWQRGPNGLHHHRRRCKSRVQARTNGSAG